MPSKDYILGLDCIIAINRDQSLSKDEKRVKKIEELNKLLNKYSGNDAEKLTHFCQENLGTPCLDKERNFYSGRYSFTQLGLAVNNGDLGVAEWLLSKNVNVDSAVYAAPAFEGKTSLSLLAATNNEINYEVLKLLIENNTDVNREQTLEDYQLDYYRMGIKKFTPIIDYAYNCRYEGFKMLVATNKINLKSLVEANQVAEHRLRVLTKNLKFTMSRLESQENINPGIIKVHEDIKNELQAKISEIKQISNYYVLWGNAITTKNCFKKKDIPTELMNLTASFLLGKGKFKVVEPCSDHDDAEGSSDVQKPKIRP